MRLFEAIELFLNELLYSVYFRESSDSGLEALLTVRGHEFLDAVAEIRRASPLFSSTGRLPPRLSWLMIRCLFLLADRSSWLVKDFRSGLLLPALFLFGLGG